MAKKDLLGCEEESDVPSQHYLLVYGVLPAISRRLGRRMLVELENPAFLKELWELAGSKLPEDHRQAVGDFHTHPYRLTEKVFLNVIELPPPLNPPEAFYAGVVMKLDDTSGDESRYFTLELGVDITGMSPSTTFLCESTEKEHSNLGERRIRSAEEFARVIAEIILGEESPLGAR